MTRESIHKMRNSLSGILANIEYAEMVIADHRLAENELRDLVAALGHARRSCNELAESLREEASRAVG